MEPFFCRLDAQPLKVARHGFDGAQVYLLTRTKEAGAIEVDVGIGNTVRAKASRLCSSQVD